MVHTKLTAKTARTLKLDFMAGGVGFEPVQCMAKTPANPTFYLKLNFSYGFLYSLIIFQ
jgi:hypothetical protein